MERLHEEMFLEISEMLDVKKRKRFARTLQGRVLAVLGLILSVNAIVRVRIRQHTVASVH